MGAVSLRLCLIFLQNKNRPAARRWSLSGSEICSIAGCFLFFFNNADQVVKDSIFTSMLSRNDVRNLSKIRQENDNPTIGLILCTKKDNTVVKYSLLSDSKQIFASKYVTYLPTEKELEKEIERECREIEMEKRLNK